jgi:hypothetical protein
VQPCPILEDVQVLWIHLEELTVTFDVQLDLCTVPTSPDSTEEIRIIVQFLRPIFMPASEIVVWVSGPVIHVMTYLMWQYPSDIEVIGMYCPKQLHRSVNSAPIMLTQIPQIRFR